MSFLNHIFIIFIKDIITLSLVDKNKKLYLLFVSI